MGFGLTRIGFCAGVLAALASATSCGGGDAGTGGDGPRAPRNHAVTVDDGFFYPPEITISDGDSVTWTWRTNDDHSVTAGTSPDPSEDPRAFDSGVRSSGPFGHRFSLTGTTTYFCREHWDMGMTGRVIVENP
jgi:plastocyanin